MNEKKRKRMCFDINEEQHKYVKVSAASRGISMNLWIHRAIQKEINRMKQYEKEELS